jgi:hypothetical protein
VKSWAQTADHAVAVGTVLHHPEVGVVVTDEFVDLLERVLVQQLRDALAGGLLALGPLVGDAALVARVGGGATVLERGDALGGGAGHVLLRRLRFRGLAHGPHPTTGVAALTTTAVRTPGRCLEPPNVLG